MLPIDLQILIASKMGKKNYTFSLDVDFVEKAKQTIEKDSLLTYSSFNHFVEVAMRKEFQIAFSKQKSGGEKNNKITPNELD
jgi:hypothetical protein